MRVRRISSISKCWHTSGDLAVIFLRFMHHLHLLERRWTDLVSLQGWQSDPCSHAPNLPEMPWGVFYGPALRGSSCPAGPALSSQLYTPVVLGSFGIWGSTTGLELAMKLGSCPGIG